MKNNNKLNDTDTTCNVNIGNNITKFMTDMGLYDYKDIAPLYQDYIRECSMIFDEVNKSFDNLSINYLLKVLHNIKGVSANLYVDTVQIVASNLHNLLKDVTDSNDNISIYKESWESIYSEYLNATDDILSFFNTKKINLR